MGEREKYIRTARVIHTHWLKKLVRREDEVEMVERPVDTIAVEAGHVAVVRHIVGSTVDSVASVEYLEFDRGEDGLKLVTFDVDSVVVVEGLSREDFGNPKVFSHIRYAFKQKAPWSDLRELYRVGEEGQVPIFHNNICRAGDRHLVARKLRKLGDAPVVIPGGLDYAVAYNDDVNGAGGETIVPDMPPHGSMVWEAIGGDPRKCNRCFIISNERYNELSTAPDLRIPRESRYEEEVHA